MGQGARVMHISEHFLAISGIGHLAIHVYLRKDTGYRI